jgi:hypothetical protein
MSFAIRTREDILHAAQLHKMLTHVISNQSYPASIISKWSPESQEKWLAQGLTIYKGGNNVKNFMLRLENGWFECTRCHAQFHGQRAFQRHPCPYSPFHYLRVPKNAKKKKTATTNPTL